MIGRPKEHLKETMEKLIETVLLEKGINLINKNIHAAKKIDNKDRGGNVIAEGELFSTFSEIEIEAENITDIIRLAFKYLPSHVEIIEPEGFKFRNNDMNLMINEILSRLHNYDAVAKAALMNNQVLASRIEEIMQKQESQNSIKTSEGPAPLKISYGEKYSKKDRKEKGKKVSMMKKR
jgi:hypothetical protein